MLYPPLTYLRAEGTPQVERIGEVAFTVVSVKPSF